MIFLVKTFSGTSSPGLSAKLHFQSLKSEYHKRHKDSSVQNKRPGEKGVYSMFPGFYASNSTIQAISPQVKLSSFCSFSLSMILGGE